MGTQDGRLMMMHKFENMTIESYDVTGVASGGHSESETDNVMGDPSYLHGVIKGTNRYVVYCSSKNQVGVWDLALRKHVRCVGIGKMLMFH